MAKAKVVLNLGTSVKIQTVLDVEDPTSVTITIYDPSEVKKITDVAMSKLSARVYEYNWQSDEDTDNDGEYQFIITVTSGDKISVETGYFTLVDITP